ncbi:hypothetical protein [Actinoplanes sp. HUAS TT8]|uniref:hypothetical protein n=1 Tax=Actinoplanes sp. HUAS TT8 TaxID=3447453 RepID=UPI003F51F500
MTTSGIENTDLTSEDWMAELRARAAVTRRRREAAAAERRATAQRRAHGLVERHAARLMRARARPPE